MKQTTSIEWLAYQIYLRGPVEDSPQDTPEWLQELYDQAKQMHKEQMLEFGSKVTERWGMSPVEPRFIEDEYNKYFKTNEQ